jgi:hypothetical protein
VGVAWSIQPEKSETPAPKKNIGLFASHQMPTGIWFEFLIERDYMYILEIDPDVKSYQSQPRRQIATALMSNSLKKF